MSPRPRSAETRDLPSYLYATTDRRTGVTYYRYAGPNGRMYGPGTDRRHAIDQARDANEKRSAGLFAQTNHVRHNGQDSKQAYLYALERKRFDGMTCDEWIENNFHRFIYGRKAIIASAQPFPSAHRKQQDHSCVYVLLRNGLITYVGQTSQTLEYRLTAHWQDGKQFSHVWWVDGLPRELLNDMEAFYMEWLSPPENVRPPAMGASIYKKHLRQHIEGAGDVS